MGKISNRPASISKLSSSLAQGAKAEKFPVGPTMPKPGPMLLIQALSAVKASSIVESVGLELAETEKDRPADVMKCTLHIVLRGEAAE